MPYLKLVNCVFERKNSQNSEKIKNNTSKIRGVTIKYPDNGHKILQNCSISLYLSSFESLNLYKFIASEKIEMSYLVSELHDFLVT